MSDLNPLACLRLESSVVGAAARIGRPFFPTFDRFDDELLCLVGVTPMVDRDPLVGFKVFVVLEEVLDLFEGDRGKLLKRFDLFVSA